MCSCLTALQHKVNPCYYVQLCRADDFYVRCSRLNILVFLTRRGFQALKPHPILPQGSSRFPLLCGKGQHVYILVFLSDNGPLSALPAPCCEIHQKLLSSWSEPLKKMRPWFFCPAMDINPDAPSKASYIPKVLFPRQFSLHSLN